MYEIYWYDAGCGGGGGGGGLGFVLFFMNFLKVNATASLVSNSRWMNNE